MTGYTPADLLTIKSAILALATGDRVVSVTVSGRTTQWQSANLAELRALRDEIEVELGTGSPRPIRVSPRAPR